MTEESERYARLADAFADKVAAVPRQAFGPEVVVPAGADEQVKLLAFLGRTF